MEVAQPATTDGPPPRVAVGWWLGGALAYLATFWIAAAVVRRHLASQAPGYVALIPEARRDMLLSQVQASDLLSHVALLILPLLVITLLLNWLRHGDPLRGLGLLPSRGWLAAAVEAFTTGVLAHLAVLLGAAALSGGSRTVGLVLATAVGHTLRWMDCGPLSVTALPAAVLAYAAARLLLPLGYLRPLWRQRGGPLVAALAVAGLIVGPYLLSPVITPLALANLLLLGLIAERLYHRAGSLWAPFGALTGWVLVGELSGLPHQGLALELPTFLAGAPALLTGGAFGAEGGLVATSVLSFWLVCLTAAPGGRITTAD